MKTKNVLMLALATSMVFGLSACPKNEDANCSAEGTLSIGTHKRIFKIGERVNLDEYVKVVGLCGSLNYTATLAPGSEKIAQIREHTLILTDEGDFKVVIAAGPSGNQKKANFVGTIYSELRMSLYEATRSISTSFAFQGIESNGTDLVVTEQIFHNQNYYFECRTKNDGTKKGKGYIKFPLSSKAYAFNCNDFDGQTFEYAGRDFEFDKRNVMSPWQLDIDSLVAEMDINARDYLDLNVDVRTTNPNLYSNFAEEFAANALGVQLDETSKYRVSGIHIYSEKFEETPVFYFDLLIRQGEKLPELYGRYKLLTGTDATCPWLNAKLQAAEEPEPIDSSALLEKIVRINNAGNYTMTLEQHWEDKDGNQYDDPFNEDNHELDGKDTFKSVLTYVPQATEVIKVDTVKRRCKSEVVDSLTYPDNKTYEGVVRGYKEINEYTYMIDNIADTQTLGLGGLVAHPYKGVNILDVINKYSLSALNPTTTAMKDFDAIGYETQGESGQRYLFKGAGKNAEVIYNAIGMFQTLGYLYNSLWSQSSLKKSYEYFDCEFYFDDDTPLQLTGEVVHEFEDEGTFVYCFDITISDLNETNVDLGFSSIVMETDHDSRVALTDIVGTWALTGSSTISQGKVIFTNTEYGGVTTLDMQGSMQGSITFNTIEDGFTVNHNLLFIYRFGYDPEDTYKVTPKKWYTKVVAYSYTKNGETTEGNPSEWYLDAFRTMDTNRMNVFLGRETYDSETHDYSFDFVPFGVWSPTVANSYDYVTLQKTAAI